MTVSPNPFQASFASSKTAATESKAAVPAVTDFYGGLTRQEYGTVEALVHGRKFWSAKVGWLVVAVCVLVALSYDAFISGELDYLLENTFVLVAISAVAGVYLYQQRKHRREMNRLVQEQQGIFAPVKGQFRAGGLTLWAGGHVPVGYGWDDFVGYRRSGDVLILYLDFPEQLNILSASRFGEPSVWSEVVATVTANVPEIKSGAKKAPRRVSEKQRIVQEASKLMEASRWKESSDFWTELLAIDADHVTGLIGQTVCQVALGKNEAAFASANRAIKLGAGDRTTLLLRANLRAERGDYEGAVGDLNRLIERDSDDSEVLRDRGLAYLKVGRLELALKDTDAALELAPADAVAWNNRGAILIELGRFDEATETLKTAVELDPGFDRPKAHLEYLQNRYQKAFVEST